MQTDNTKLVEPQIPDRVAEINRQIQSSPLSSLGIAQAPSVINTSLLAPTQPLELTAVKQPTEAIGLGEQITGLTTADKERRQKEAERVAKINEVKRAEVEKQASQQTFVDKILGRKSQEELQSELYPEKVDVLEQEITDIESQIIAEQRALQKKTEELQKNQKGLYREAVQSEINRVTRESVAKQADLSILQMAKQGRYEIAKSIADRKINAVLEQQKNEVEAYKSIYETNKELFDKKEQRLYEENIAQKERDLNKIEKEEKLLFDTILSTMISAAENGAPTDLLKKIQEAKSPQDAIRLAGSWINRLNIDKIINNVSDVQEEQLYTGLKPATATAVRSQVSAFKTEPLVQNFATIQEGNNFASSLADTTKNPADDQALIYALAKALDPGSVVREGEYATAQKYAQSWVKAYGKGITQAIAGTGFLSEEARRNIKKTIETKFNASKKSYDALRSSYVNGINDLTGRDDGEKFVRDYRTEILDGTSTRIPKDEVKEIYDNNPTIRETIDQMVADGVDWEEVLQAIR